MSSANKTVEVSVWVLIDADGFSWVGNDKDSVEESAFEDGCKSPVRVICAALTATIPQTQTVRAVVPDTTEDATLTLS